jgi:hypothetical protein
MIYSLFVSAGRMDGWMTNDADLGGQSASPVVQTKPAGVIPFLFAVT